MSKKHNYILSTAFLLVFAAALVWIACSTRDNASEIYDSLGSSELSEINSLADSCLDAGDAAQAIVYYTLMTTRCDRDGNPAHAEDYIRAYNNLGYAYYLFYSDYPKAYNNFLKALEVAESNKYPRISPIYQNLGNIYFSLGDTLSAISYSKKALEMAIRDENHYIETTALSDLVSLAGQNCKGDSLKAICQMFNPISIPDSVPLKNYAVLAHKAASYIISNQTDSLINVLREMPLAVNTPYEPERHKANAIALLAATYRKIGNLTSELQELITLDSLGKAYGMNDIRIPALKAISQNLKKQGKKTEASAFKQKAINLEDSVINKNKVRTIMEMESLHKTDKLNDRIKIIDTERRFQTIIIIILSVAICIILILGLWILWRYVVQARYTKALYEKNMELANRHLTTAATSAQIYNPDLISRPVVHNDDVPDKVIKKESGNNIDNLRVKISERVLNLMETDPIIFSKDFTIDNVAEILEEKKYIISQVINDYLGMNFNNFLADYRIKEACRRLSDRDTYGHLTIEAISEDLGFKSRSNFTTQFKRVTGLTPTEFIKMSRQHNH